MPDWITRTIAEMEAKLSAQLPPGYTATFDDTPLSIQKPAAHLVVSEDLLMDAGVIPDTRPPVRVSRWIRLRWAWRAWRERVGRKVGGWIAGVDLSERDDDW